MKKIIFVLTLIFLSVSLTAQETENWRDLNHNSAVECKNRFLKLTDDSRSYYRLRLAVTYGENHPQEKNSIMIEQGYSTILVKMLYKKTGTSFMYVEIYLSSSRTDVMTNKTADNRLFFNSEDEYLPRVTYENYFLPGNNKEVMSILTQLFTSMGF